jgi:uncharacterized caspase-like protein
MPGKLRKAVLIGIDNYETDRLDACVNDAKKMAEMLEKHEDGRPNFEVTLCISNETEEELGNHINQLFNQPYEAVLLYFSGHGQISQDSGFLKLPDGNSFDPGIPMNYLLSTANKSSAKHKIIILDCCHSGCIDENDRGAKTVIKLNTGVTVLASSLPSEKATILNQQSLFTNLVLEALAGRAANSNGEITTTSIYSYVEGLMRSTTQHPVFKANISELLSVRNVIPKYENNILR